MVDQPALAGVAVEAAAPDGVLQRAQHQVGVGPVGGLPAHDPPRERIPHAGQPQRPLPGGDPGDVGHPQPVRLACGELAVDQVRRRRRPWVLAGRRPPPLAHKRALQASLAHEPLHALAADPDAVAAQLGVDPWRPVGAARAGMDSPDPAEQELVVQGVLAGRAPPGHPPVEGRDRDLEDPEDGLDPEPVTMLSDKRHDRRRVGSSSAAK